MTALEACIVCYSRRGVRPPPRPGRASRAGSQRGGVGAGARRLSSLRCAAGSRGRLSGRKRAAASDWSSDDDDSPPPPVRRNHAKAKRGGGGSGGGGSGDRVIDVDFKVH